MTSNIAEYNEKVEQQIKQFEGGNRDKLPDAFSYWSRNFIAPKFASVFGTYYVHEIFAQLLVGAFPIKEKHYRFASLGSGDCENVEIKLAQQFRDMGITRFTIDCYEISDGLRTRAASSIQNIGLSEHFNLIASDINHDPLLATYDGIIAHHALHHFVNLERIFDDVKSKLEDNATFAVYDMIGRNGHMRWPEVEILVRAIWDTLDPSKKFHHQLNVRWDEFINFDCSNVGFEGIRSQDIMPNLLSRFHFSHCVTFGGLTEVFFDRAFGHNFEPNNPLERAFINMLERLENTLIDARVIKPTIMFAGLRKEPVSCKFIAPRSPLFCLRPPTPAAS